MKDEVKVDEWSAILIDCSDAKAKNTERSLDELYGLVDRLARLANCVDHGAEKSRREVNYLAKGKDLMVKDVAEALGVDPELPWWNMIAAIKSLKQRAQEEAEEIARIEQRAVSSEKALAEAKARPFEFLHGLGYRAGNASVTIERTASARALSEAATDAPREMTPKEFLAVARAEGMLPDPTVSKAEFVPTGRWLLVYNATPPPRARGHIEQPTDVLQGDIQAFGREVVHVEDRYGNQLRRVLFQRQHAIEIARRPGTFSGRGESDLFFVHADDLLGGILSP